MLKYFLVFLLVLSTPCMGMDAANQGGTDFFTGQATVTTSATDVLPATKGYPQQRGWIIRNMDSANPIYIGRDNTLTTGNGFILKAGETITIGAQCNVWMISTGGSVTICWLAPLY